MQQLSRSFHEAFRDMGTRDLSIFQGTLIFRYFKYVQTLTSSKSFFATQLPIRPAKYCTVCTGRTRKEGPGLCRGERQVIRFLDALLHSFTIIGAKNVTF